MTLAQHSTNVDQAFDAYKAAPTPALWDAYTQALAALRRALVAARKAEFIAKWGFAP